MAKKRKPASKRTKTTSGFRFRTKLSALCPTYQIEQDDDGQIVVHTGLRDDGNDNYVPFDDDND